MVLSFRWDLTKFMSFCFKSSEHRLLGPDSDCIWVPWGKGIKAVGPSLGEGDITRNSMSEEEQSHYHRIPLSFAAWVGRPSLTEAGIPLYLAGQLGTDSWGSQRGTHIGKGFLCCFIFSFKGWSFMLSFLIFVLILDDTMFLRGLRSNL